MADLHAPWQQTNEQTPTTSKLIVEFTYNNFQMIKQISVESVEIEEDEGLEVSFADVLERSITKFNVLRPSISNFFGFYGGSPSVADECLPPARRWSPWYG